MFFFTAMWSARCANQMGFFFVPQMADIFSYPEYEKKRRKKI
jgi:hypothetical protein